MLEPHELDMTIALYISFIGIIFHAIISIIYKDYVNIRVESAIIDNFEKSVFVRSFSDVVVCLGVFIASWLIKYEIYIADSFTSLLISIYIFYKAVPVMISSGKVLVQSSPSTIVNLLEQNLLDVDATDGVHGVISGKTHFWTYSPGVFVGTIHVRINQETDEQFIRRRVQEIFAPYVKHLTVQIEKWEDIIGVSQ